MHVLICDNQIAGVTDTPDSLPTGYQVYEYSGSAALDNLYWSGGEVLAKPPKPGGNYIWSNADESWIKVALPTVLPTPQWPQLAADLTRLPVWSRVYELADTSLPVNNAFTMLQTVLTATKDGERLQMAIAKLRTALAMANEDLTAAEVDEINAALTANHFDLQLEAA